MKSNFIMKELESLTPFILNRLILKFFNKKRYLNIKSLKKLEDSKRIFKEKYEDYIYNISFSKNEIFQVLFCCRLSKTNGII